jgi:hypothetical protein
MIKNYSEKKVTEINKKSTDLSLEMSKHQYTITAEKLNPGLEKMWKIIRMMGFKNDETDKIIESVRNDLLGREMKKGDSFKDVIGKSFSDAILNAVEKIKEKQRV